MNQQGGYRIALNFFALCDQHFEFMVYRRRRQENERREEYPGCKDRNLPVRSASRAKSTGPDFEYQKYWVSLIEKEEFDPFVCTSKTNNYLTIDYLYHLLRQNCSTLYDNEYTFEERRFDSRVLFILSSHAEGREVVWLQPYLLRSKGEFGFLADFKLDAPSNAKISGRSLELSLALKNGRPNRDFYADRVSKLQQFVSRYHDRVFPLRSDPTSIRVGKTLREVESDLLHSKRYIVGGNNTSKSQFLGVKEYGPLRPAQKDIKVYFVYRPNDKPLSYDLYRALRGDTFKTFSGMNDMFQFTMDKNSIGGAPTIGFDASNLQQVCKAIEIDAEGRPVVPILITPFSKEGNYEDTQAYYLAKHTILKHGWPSQFVTLNTLKNTNILKWSTANIGLQLFAKMGGQPWKVQPETDPCLIVGLGQSHKVENHTVKKYFAYSVLTDSSGLYKDPRVLGSSPNHSDYIHDFKSNLRQIFEEFRDGYNRFVVHTTFKI
jgi:hypothetical protein